MDPDTFSLADLANLSRAQLETIRQRCMYHLQHKTSRSTLEDEDWLKAGILTELRRRGADNRSTFSARKSSASFVTQSARIRALLDDAAPGLSLTERHLLGEIAARALADYITYRHRQVSMASMVELVSMVPEAIDRSFPGYIEAGLLPLVVKARSTVNNAATRGPATVISTRIHRDNRRTDR